MELNYNALRSFELYTDVFIGRQCLENKSQYQYSPRVGVVRKRSTGAKWANTTLSSLLYCLKNKRGPIEDT